ncbi:hypothetical protein [Vibrio cyclitrophicus]|uniref:hypothetical protein n=1 Tax=Vibrio cyclitrophicus TaxID=47951 RepID=UPI000C861586|nr:hypothetical protein [Vibrio cyclitrophicus]PME34492.1 hypothetical protein BCV37_21915 [Vibrio cyclitrophicus]PME40388.1 hypothetical protein BCV36_21305 [Vibrio cyclitrophicus]
MTAINANSMFNKAQGIEAYVKAVNDLDDHFEYRIDSLKDKAFVLRVLPELNDVLISAIHTESSKME